ncbi:MAG: TIGR03435 family protein [Vicinamibacterales bacterium]
MTIIIAILVKATAVLTVAMLAYVLAGRRASAATRHLLWTLAILGLLVLPVLVAAIPGWVRLDVSAPAAAVATAPLAPLARFATDLLPDAATLPPGDGSSSARPVAWLSVAAFVYVLGIAVLLVRLVAQRWSIARLTRRAAVVTDDRWTGLVADSARRLGVRRSVTVRRSLDHTMPMAVGTQRPSILIPAEADEWSDDRRRAVVLHELAHVVRQDCLVQTLAATATAIYWAHPGVWWVARRLRIERELACDDRVLSAGAPAHDYAGHLLEIAYALKSDVAPALAVTMAAPNHLEDRLRALLDDERPRNPPRLRSRVAAFAVMSIVVVTFAGVTIDGSRLKALGEDGAPLLAIQDAPRLAFEVASVKPNKSAETGGFIQRRPGGNFSVGNQTLRTLITFAYGLQGFQLIGGPDWIGTERFDIVAKAATDIPPTPFGGVAPESLMLRALLEDRFRLAMHRETREMPIYALVVARSDGRLGPQIRRPTSDFCAQRFKEAAKAAPPPMGTGPICGIQGNNEGLRAGAFPIGSFTNFLSSQTSRIVVDRTGLTGGWDFELKWSPPNSPSPDPDRPSIFTALEEQLGLRLEPTTGPVEVLAIDRVEALIPD